MPDEAVWMPKKTDWTPVKIIDPFPVAEPMVLPVVVPIFTSPAKIYIPFQTELAELE